MENVSNAINLAIGVLDQLQKIVINAHKDFLFMKTK
jgi:hypothetical protein